MSHMFCILCARWQPLFDVLKLWHYPLWINISNNSFKLKVQKKFGKATITYRCLPSIRRGEANKQEYIQIEHTVKGNAASITKTCLYNVDPLKPHFYIVKVRFTGVYIIFLISARRGGSNEYPQSMFWAEIRKISDFLSENFQFFGCKIFSILE